MEKNDINGFVPSLLNPRTFKKDRADFSLTQNSVASRCSLSLRRNNELIKPKSAYNICTGGKENSQSNHNISRTFETNLPKNASPVRSNKNTRNVEIEDDASIGFSAIHDLDTVVINQDLSPLNFLDFEPEVIILELDKNEVNLNHSLITVSSATELDDCISDKTVLYDIEKPKVSVSFGINNCKAVDVSTSKSCLKRVHLSTEHGQTTVHCDIIEGSHVSTESNLDENMNQAIPPSQTKKSTAATDMRSVAVAVNLEIKRKKLSDESTENSKVLILNTDAIEKLSHVIVQPPNYRLVKRQTLDRNKIKRGVKRKSPKSPLKHGKSGDGLKQRSIEEYLSARDVEQDMSKNSGVADAVKCDRIGRGSCKSRRDNESPRSAKPGSRRSCESPRYQDIKISSSDAPRVPSPRSKNESISSHSPRKNVDSIQFSLPPRSKSTKTSVTRTIPHHKIVAGTHFAVDAFSYGEIPNVKHYFLTHFHSDHYSGLKKAFNKLLFCSKITADLCITRLGVNPRCIRILNQDESIRVESVEVMAVDANHCPGALMLVFTLPNGKTLLHTGDFRASPTMESYPIFWNRDIHTVYLDTTYCNPRYDFPTQDQSLEMALYLLRQKKLVLEKAGKKFSSVLIVCGTYTIGKEKFFLGMARRVGCSVWACPEKDRVLQAVEGRSFSHAPPHSCQLHVVPMRDLTHEKLRSYLDSLQGAFGEIVAFKPSGWENGKNSSVEKDLVTIHGIPYSEHSSFSEMIRFVKYLKPKQVVPTVDISGGIKTVQKYFPCPLVYKEDIQCQSKVTDYFSIQNRQQVPAVT